MLAVTVYDPVALLAVSAGAVATPLALVVAVAVAEPLNVAPAPDAGAVNVTVTPLTGSEFEVTVACRAVPNTVPTVALWGVPAVAAMVGLPDPPASAAAFRVTLPVPDVITQLTVRVCPAEAAL
jgi:hypothetical protein